MKNKTVLSEYAKTVTHRITLLPTWKRVYVGILWSIYTMLNKAIFSAIGMSSNNGENRWLYIWQAGKLLAFSGYTGSEESLPRYEEKYKEETYKKEGKRPWVIFHISMIAQEAGIMANGYYEEEL